MHSAIKTFQQRNFLIYEQGFGKAAIAEKVLEKRFINYVQITKDNQDNSTNHIFAQLRL